MATLTTRIQIDPVVYAVLNDLADRIEALEKASKPIDDYEVKVWMEAGLETAKRLIRDETRFLSE